MPSDLQVTNIKANDGTAGISIADSTGRVTFSENNPSITLGSNTTFPTGKIINSGVKFITDGNHTTSSTTEEAAFDYESISTTSGNTIIYGFHGLWKCYSNGNNTLIRYAPMYPRYHTSSVSEGATSDTDDV